MYRPVVVSGCSGAPLPGVLLRYAGRMISPFALHRQLSTCIGTAQSAGNVGCLPRVGSESCSTAPTSGHFWLL
eukprot:6210167-Pleurochrysis_carterae.AAC.2